MCGSVCKNGQTYLTSKDQIFSDTGNFFFQVNFCLCNVLVHWLCPRQGVRGELFRPGSCNHSLTIATLATCWYLPLLQNNVVLFKQLWLKIWGIISQSFKPWTGPNLLVTTTYLLRPNLCINPVTIHTISQQSLKYDGQSNNIKKFYFLFYFYITQKLKLWTL